jgi:hypothetical protein
VYAVAAVSPALPCNPCPRNAGNASAPHSEDQGSRAGQFSLLRRFLQLPGNPDQTGTPDCKQVPGAPLRPPGLPVLEGFPTGRADEHPSNKKARRTPSVWEPPRDPTAGAARQGQIQAPGQILPSVHDAAERAVLLRRRYRHRTIVPLHQVLPALQSARSRVQRHRT